MPRRVNLTEDKKRRIADLYHNSNLSVGSIAEREGISIRTVHNWKNYGYPVQSSNGFSHDDNQSIQTITLPEKPEKKDDSEGSDDSTNEYTEKKQYEYLEITKCPDCDSPKDKWIPIEKALKLGYGIPDRANWFYDYMCSECARLIPEKRIWVPGICSNCRSTSIDWMPIEEAHVSEEEKRIYDFVCVNCWELITI